MSFFHLPATPEKSNLKAVSGANNGMSRLFLRVLYCFVRVGNLEAEVTECIVFEIASVDNIDVINQIVCCIDCSKYILGNVFEPEWYFPILVRVFKPILLLCHPSSIRMYIVHLRSIKQKNSCSAPDTHFIKQ